LIGELVKFNVEAFKVFDKVLSSTERVGHLVGYRRIDNYYGKNAWFKVICKRHCLGHYIYFFFSVIIY